jgi:hypothetical protein
VVRRTDRSCAEILWALFEFPMPTGGCEKEHGLLDQLHLTCADREREFEIRNVIRRGCDGSARRHVWQG